jgi:8-amino-7-oxononanoate synthase
MTTGALRNLGSILDEIKAAQRYRAMEPCDARRGPIDFSSNDYLGLAEHPEVVAALGRASRVGSGGSRLLGGTHREHLALERELAQWLGRERALIFSSGYLAAIGAVCVLGDALGRIASDERNHASLIDGARLSRAQRTIYPHSSAEQMLANGGPTLVVTESIFSMDGDAIDAGAMLARLRSDDLLLVDEAHGLGVAGRGGAGLALGLDDDRVVVLGTFSKAFGTHGGFVAGAVNVTELLINRARSFIFDTALPPPIVEATRCALRLIGSMDDARTRLRENAGRLRHGLAQLGTGINAAHETGSPIVPFVVGSDRRALETAQLLRSRGIVAPAIRPPTVPEGSARLRFSVRAAHQLHEVDRTIEALRQCTVTS